MCNETFEVLRLSTFVFKKFSEKTIFTIIFVVKSLKGFRWHNVGPASQMVAQHYFTIGPMHRVIQVVAFRGIKRHPYGSHSKHWTITQLCFNVGPASNVYQLHRTDAYTHLSAVVVEGIGLHVEDILVSLVLSIIISWTFRILAHDGNQYSYVYKIFSSYYYYYLLGFVYAIYTNIYNNFTNIKL